MFPANSWMKSGAGLVLLLLCASGVQTNADSLKQAKEKFRTEDTRLNKAYKEARAELGTTKGLELQKDEQAWLSYRDYIAEGFPHFNTGKQVDEPKLTADYWRMMADLTKERADFLRIYSGKKVPAGVTGEYSDCHGGYLELEETKGGLLFSISVVRGPTAHGGELVERAQRNGNKAYFKDKPDPQDDSPPCELTFTITEGHIVTIEGKNTRKYHGMRAYFDGKYFKTGPLKKPIKPE